MPATADPPARPLGPLDQRQRSMLLVHELAHVRRGDHAVRLFELAVTVLFWWLPTVWWARRALHDAEEQCCDAWVTWAFPEGRPVLRRDSAGNHRFCSRKRISRAGLGDRLRQGPSSPKEVDHDHAGNDVATTDLARRPGGLCRGCLAPAYQPELGPEARKGRRTEDYVVETSEVAEIPSVEARFEPIETKIEVVVADENQKTAIKADSLDDAVKLLHERIEKLASEKGRLGSQ